MFKSLLLRGRTLFMLLACLLSSLVVTAQTKVTGKVIGSDDRQPVVGASVRVKGTTVGSLTDVNGVFTLNASTNSVLVITYIGYNAKEVTVTGSSIGTIVLQSSSKALNEVVVTGYTSQRRKDISGSVASVDVTEAKKIPATTSENLLQGQAAGVTVVESGAPGAGANVYIRGISSLGNVSPLYVIDGVQAGDMSNVNPNDIESITVLKDAGSTAIYGVRGGNGVVVITTKKGKQGKTKFTYDAYYGRTSPLQGNVWHVMNAAQFQQLVKTYDPQNSLLGPNHDGFKDYGYQSSSKKGVGNADDPNTNPANYYLDPTNPGNDYLIQKFNNTTGTDWFHTVFKSAPIQSHTVSASGANEKNNYFFSLAYLNQQGSLIDTYFKRYQARVNTNFSITNHIRVGESGQVFYTTSPGFTNQNEGNAISETYRMEPQIPVYDIGGNYGGTYAGPTQLGNASNPVANQERTKNNYGRGYNVEGSMYAEADFLKYFTLRTSINGRVNNFYYNGINYNPYDQGEGHANKNGAYEGGGYNVNYNWTNTIRYDETFGKHNVKFIGGYEASDYQGRFINASVNTLFSLDPNYVAINNGDPKSIQAQSGPRQEVSTLSTFARVDYIYNDRYILSGTVRRDGSSVFYPGRQYGTFPSGTLAWRVSQEDFMKGISWINDLKLRGSYGTSGYNSNVGGGNAYSAFASSIQNSAYDITGSSTSAVSGFYAGQLGNTKTTWETDKTADVGLDATLFGNHLDLTFDYFNKVSSNLLFGITLPATVGGANAPAVNIGSITNHGVDFGATYHGSTGDFKFNLGANISAYRAIVDKLSSPYFETNYQRQGALTRNIPGGPLGAFYGYKVIGYWQSQAEIDAANAAAAAKYGAGSVYQVDAAPGRFKYADINGDGRITDKSRTIIGNPNPDFTYGINLNAQYKGFDLTAILYGSYGNKDYNYIKYWTGFYSTFAGNKNIGLLTNSWSPSNPNAAFPKVESVGSFSTDATINSWYVESGSFLKCRLLQLGYTFDSKQLKSVGVGSLHLYIAAQNLFTITKYTGLDPELTSVANNGIGTDIGSYPNNERKFLLGVNLSF